MSRILRGLLMVAALAGGYVWLTPRAERQFEHDARFVEQAELAGCLNRHSMVHLAEVFDNIMPWMSSVGAAAAAGDYDNDGAADLYVTNSGRGESNRLLRNRGDGRFEDVTATAGVGCPNVEGGCMHAIWGDVDGDARLDLYVTKWAAANTLYRNNGDGTFTDISAAAGVDYWGYGNAATFLDYDRDGRLDILLGNYFAETVVDPQSGARVRNDLWHPVTTRVMHETFTHADNGGHKVLYHNIGNGTFAEVTEASGITYTGWALAVGAGDLNNDGWPDVYVANDFGPDELYLNTGATENPPRFRLVIDPRGHPGLGNDWWKGMNVDFGDVNNDGYLDIYVTNVLSRQYKTDEGNMLWLNCVEPAFPGGRGFRNVAEAAGANDGGWGWGGKIADFNNDGFADIFTVNGFVTGDANRNYWYQLQEMVTQTKNQTADAADWPEMDTRDLSGREASRLFIQVRSGPARTDSAPYFVEVAETCGITDTLNGRGIAVADYNLDGAVDLFIANQGAPSSYYLNQALQTPAARGRGFMRLTLVGRPDAGLQARDRTFASTTDAVGARVTLHLQDGLQMREVQGGTGFASQSEHAVHFGLPDPAAVTSMDIWWPSGRTEHLAGAAVQGLVNRHVRIVEGQGEMQTSGGSAF